jgi:hypothetical protein
MELYQEERRQCGALCQARQGSKQTDSRSLAGNLFESENWTKKDSQQSNPTAPNLKPTTSTLLTKTLTKRPENTHPNMFLTFQKSTPKE